jgi:cob(I)alamin adenosyltransferase
MVQLNRIYTKSGDAGTTALGDGQRVSKTEPRIAAYGGVDELNSWIGVVLAQGLRSPSAEWLTAIQNDLFDVGADLCVPLGEEPRLRVSQHQVDQLEAWIDLANSHLEPLQSFVLPGGAVPAAYLHLARSVCRRVEIGVVALSESVDINVQTIAYLNRLSDLLFVLARLENLADKNDENDPGCGEVLWRPGQNRTSDGITNGKDEHGA